MSQSLNTLREQRGSTDLKLTQLSASQTPSHDQRVIGLTGGIGMGKTTVSDYLSSAYQLPILDADLYAREAVGPDSDVFQEIVERYGVGILLANGDLDRRRLGKIIFSSSAERLWLEQRIHPYVRDRMESQMQALPAEAYPTVVLVVPLLFEARMTDLVTEVWVIQCASVQQVERLLERDAKTSPEGDRLSLEQVQARINSQMAIEKKIACAHVVLHNSSTLDDLLSQVDQAIAGTRQAPQADASPPASRQASQGKSGLLQP
ncbi:MULTISPECIES: dephospho-CoA kinase [Trichocoleus]|nr:dephospho-CoA kinase [Trichocoleus sp. FACHB-46]MBD1863531.1 dephospho-CoA kinase [Trichocoleus sp. FACHB-46]